MTKPHIYRFNGWWWVAPNRCEPKGFAGNNLVACTLSFAMELAAAA